MFVILRMYVGTDSLPAHSRPESIKLWERSLSKPGRFPVRISIVTHNFRTNTRKRQVLRKAKVTQHSNDEDYTSHRPRIAPYS